MLRHLTISFPNANDLIFVHLPNTLVSLCLRDTPRYYMKRFYCAKQHLEAALYDAPLLTCSQAFRIFRTLHTRGCSLEQLELVVLWDTDVAGLSLLRLLVASCPSVWFLELHCYRNNEHMTEDAAWHDPNILPVVSSLLYPNSCECLLNAPGVVAHRLPSHARSPGSLHCASCGSTSISLCCTASILHWRTSARSTLSSTSKRGSLRTTCRNCTRCRYWVGSALAIRAGRYGDFLRADLRTATPVLLSFWTSWSWSWTKSA